MTADKIFAGLDVSRETLDRLKTYDVLMQKWNPAINLVARSTLADGWTRHFVDSAQVFGLGKGGTHWVDLGSGGGFPGMVLAILGHDLTPTARFTLIESDQRKAAFLQTVARETGVVVEIIADRIEAVQPAAAEIITARALAPLSRLLEYAEKHIAPGGRAIFLKGAGSDAELDAALASWRFSVEKIPSLTDSQAVILSIEGIERV